MTARQAAMPANLRRTPRHPALTVRCPHCGANPGSRCTTRSGRITKTQPCPARTDAHAVATAVCPTCQTTPGTPCRDPHGRPHTTHPARHHEATRST